ncbi:twin-arginine translocase TatA/TatE family subunit [Chitinophaga qingshengii]|uniref:Sec-independent protein translocase protein TatA n=1 Tax=Chitinophaga qingshengii TaxID=1569794 RepID=A0ABR7TV02_9BACT|nr:twin-arginine translocase TatA/TatE family subunit [Chitinophaga qingshengii]MBC9933828.1 twin-arginine translocase TatA/TatE family subunit [Chitinophaga qingshengii]
MATSLLNIPFLFLQEIGIKELLLIALVVLLLFGGKKIPELMRGLGSGIREFKDAKDETPKKDSKEA